MRQFETNEINYCLKVFLANSIVSEIFKEYACLRVLHEICLSHTFLGNLYVSTFPKESTCLSFFLIILLPQFLYQICLSHYFQGNLFVSGYFTESHCLQIVCIICLSHYLLRNLIVSIFLRKCICPWLSLPNLFVSVLRKSRCLSYFQHDPTISKEICLSQ